MKIKALIAYFVSFLFLAYLSSCDSASYEMEEVEVYKDTTTVTKNTEIKQEIEQPKVEKKEETPPVTNITPSAKYTIQIGAFKRESNAREYLEHARSVFTFEFTYQYMDGLHKIRTGIYTSIDEAVRVLEIIKNAGFADSFITKPEK